MLNPASPLTALIHAPMRPGRVTWIGLRPKRHQAMVTVETATLDIRDGVIGDHYKSATTGNRHVTLIGAEDLAAIAAYLGRDRVDPQDLRRNIVIAGVNLLALKDKRFRLGSAELETTGECHPCSRMEDTFGTGGYNAVRGHGGITARVLEGGEVRLGDALSVIP